MNTFTRSENTSPAERTSAQTIDLGHHASIEQQVHRWQTSEGARVRLVTDHKRPVFDLVLRFRAGSAQDSELPGIAALALYCLDQGTESFDAAQFVDQLEGLGAIMNREIHQDHALVSLRGLSVPGLRDRAVGLLADMVARPAFREPDLEKIRSRIGGHLLSRGRSSQYVLADATMSQLFANHPYATPSAGTLESLANLTVDQLRAFHRRAYSASNLDIGIVGDLSLEQAEALVNTITQALPQGWAAAPPPPPALGKPSTRSLERAGNTTVAMLTMACQVPPTSPHYPALVMLDQILGASFESRLTQELRGRLALTYDIHSNLLPLDAASLLQISWDIAPEHLDASRSRIEQILQSLSEEGPSQVELDLALSQLTGSTLRSMAANAQLAKALAKFSHQGQPADYLPRLLAALANLTPEDIRQTARSLLATQQQVFVTRGPIVEQLPLPSPDQ
ncbi:insulinase family protein [Pseudomonas sp. BW13M1]|uniref:Insulinase family protein n=1 Tax=Pseudomonas peradeniyensis TaxID=2745488 RepID=A0A923G6W8_9PSED|nr:pitrilysin family protein [Pseudomonas peradeniyensis]MBV4505137.1 insulinase family protein [Pseudomonas peradeniyensis]